MARDRNLALPARFLQQDVVFDGSQTQMLRCKQQGGEETVLLKVPVSTFSTVAQTESFQHESQILEALSGIPGVPRCLELTEFHGRPILVFDDFVGKSLLVHMQRGLLGLEESLTILLQVVDVLGQIHKRQIVHMTVNPMHILWNPKAQALRLSDFARSVSLSAPKESLPAAEYSTAYLGYTAPEQTSQASQSIDHRTDLYALGVVAWHMLVGHAPFASSQPQQLLHAHLTSQPQAPHLLRAESPPILSQVVLRLMAKRPEDRYQSAKGLRVDLEHCLAQVRGETSLPSFALGQADHSTSLSLPDRLYGREEERQQLLEAFAQLRTGARTLLLVSGPPGIGKSTLARELKEPAFQAGGVFTEGRFALQKGEIPYHAFVQALQGLFQQILAAPQARLAEWRRKLSAALGSLGGVLVGLFPSLHHLLDEVHDAPELSPQEARNLTHTAFISLFRTIATPQHPLVLFLDDLQWADAASLELLRFLATDRNQHGLLLLGGYRDDEVHNTHPLTHTLLALSRENVPSRNLSLEGLSLEELADFLTDSLGCTVSEVAPLARALLERTAGNPFFLHTLLKRLEKEGFFVPSGSTWSWRKEGLRTIPATDNVVSLLVETLQELEPQTRLTLQCAACVGHRFSLQRLHSVLQMPREELAQHLSVVDGTGLLRLQPTSQGGFGEVYSFVHDRIQEAALAGLSQEQQGHFHREIARDLLVGTESLEEVEELFEVMGHLQRAYALCPFPDWEERHLAARVAFATGRRARRSAALESAFDCFEWGLEVLGEEGWQQDFSLTYDLTYASAEAGFLVCDEEIVTRRLAVLRERARSFTEEIPAWSLDLRFHTVKSRLKQALGVTEAFLEKAGIPRLEKPNPIRELWSLTRILWRIAFRKPEDLLQLPEASDPVHRGIISMQVGSAFAYHGVKPELGVPSMLRDILSAFRYGATAEGAQCWTALGIMLAEGFGLVKLGFRYANLAKVQAEALQRPDLSPRFAFFTHYNLAVYTHTFAQIEAEMEEIGECAIKVGDLNIAEFAFSTKLYLAFMRGRNLELVNSILEQHLAFISLYRLEFTMLSSRLLSDVVRDLRRAQPIRLPVRMLEEKTLSEPRSSEVLFADFFNLHRCLLFADLDSALPLLHKSHPLLKNPTVATMRGAFWTYLLVLMFRALALGKGDTRRIKQHIRQGSKKLRHWCLAGPGDGTYRLRWVEAARFASEGEELKALSCYDLAIQQAEGAGFSHDAALIAEQTATFCEETQRIHMAEFFRQKAFEGYVRWGAWSKVASMEEAYPALAFLAENATGSASSSSGVRFGPLPTQERKMMDLDTVLQAAKALNQESERPKLLRRLMQLVLENAGAERCSLLLLHEDQWSIAAEVSSASEEIATTAQPFSLDEQDDAPFPNAMLRYVLLTHESVVLRNATEEGPFLREPYILQERPRSVLCSPLLLHKRLVGLLYLENRQVAGVFTTQRRQVLDVIATQAAISMEAVYAAEIRAQQSGSLDVRDALRDSKGSSQETKAITPSSTSRVLSRQSRRALDGLRLGQWRLLKKLGEGGMAVVYEAQHVSEPKRAALKLLQHRDLSETQARRFRREAETLSLLKHPHIVEVYEFGDDPSLGHFIVLEFLAGRDLRAVIHEHAPLPIGWLLEISEQLCDALQTCHEAGVIHRDLKPSNVFLLPDRAGEGGDFFPTVKLIDFGIAKTLKRSQETQLTSTGAIIGTPAYLSPEQLKERGVLTPATDVYGLGLLWFLALTGQHPLGEGSNIEMFVKILQEEPLGLGVLRPEFRDSPLEELLLRMLRKNPKERPQSIAQVWDELAMACQMIEDPLDEPDVYARFLLPHEPQASSASKNHVLSERSVT